MRKIKQSIFKKSKEDPFYTPEFRCRWKISGCQSQRVFFKNISSIIPPGSELFLEGTPSKGSCQKQLLKFHDSNIMNINRDTLVPKLDLLKFHFNDSTAELILRACLDNSKNIMATHIKIVNNKELLVYWHDASCDDVLYLSDFFDRDAVVGLSLRMKTTFSEMDG